MLCLTPFFLIIYFKFFAFEYLIIYLLKDKTLCDKIDFILTFHMKDGKEATSLSNFKFV